jgi:anti-sigma factor RsiW
MICERCNSRLSAYIDGKLSAAETRELNEHLTACRRCREDLRELNAVRAILRRLPEHEARQGFWDDALRAVRLRGRRRRVQWSPRLAVGAAGAAVALAAVVLLSRQDRSDFVPISPPASETVINPVSLVSLHTRERARSPLIDVGKVRFAGDEAEAADIAEDGRFDVQ